jgi:hypothetical protein
VPSPYRIERHGTLLHVYIVLALAGLGVALAPPEQRRPILLAAGAIALPLALRQWSLLVFGYAALAIALARMQRVPIVVRFLIAFAAWLAVAIFRLRMHHVIGQAQAILLAQLWVGTLYSAMYLIIERARTLPDERTTITDDAFYMLAPPRLVMPFFQPISPREVILAQRPNFPRRLLWRGAGLAAYALVCAIAANQLDQYATHVPTAIGLAIGFMVHYAKAAYLIFLAMAAFRLYGYDVASGFRMPFLSRSFADFFRRYNHYVRDAVVSLFFLPALGHLRTRMPRRTASIVAAYFGIFIGSLALQDLLIPAGITLHPLSTMENLLRPQRIVGMLIMWSLIVIPNAGIAPRRRPPVSKLRALFQIALVDTIYAGLWYLQRR